MGYLTALFMSTTIQLNLPPNLLSSICYVETRHNINAIHYNDGGEDSLGICQIHYSTAVDMGFKGTPEQLMEPKNNILYAGKYLSHLLKRYNHTHNRAIIAYNMGHAGSLTMTNYSVKVYKVWRKE
jgi:soluble lytic murein transglycosylase-like protein